MGNRQSTPIASCDLICGRGQPITTIASLCARRFLPAGGEREEEGEEGEQIAKKDRANDGESEDAEKRGRGRS